MTDEQRKRFDELLIVEAQKRGSLSVVDIMMLREAFFSVEIERQQTKEGATDDSKK